MRDLRDWLPYSPESFVDLTYVEEAVPYTDQPDRPRHLRLVHSVMRGTARSDERRAFADGEGVWWIRGHHDETSPDGQALMAAWALERST